MNAADVITIFERLNVEGRAYGYLASTMLFNCLQSNLKRSTMQALSK